MPVGFVCEGFGGLGGGPAEKRDEEKASSEGEARGRVREGGARDEDTGRLVNPGYPFILPHHIFVVVVTIHATAQRPTTSRPFFRMHPIPTNNPPKPWSPILDDASFRRLWERKRTEVVESAGKKNPND
jgi:hypothetical protein